jgi:hypothetical protein
MIEEYVLELKSKYKLGNERTRQIMSFLILQFMLKNILPGDFVVTPEGKIKDIRLPVSPQVGPSGIPCTRERKTIPVISMSKDDLGKLRSLPYTKEEKENPSKSSVFAKNSSVSISSYDLWSKFVETAIFPSSTATTNAGKTITEDG